MESKDIKDIQDRINQILNYIIENPQQARRDLYHLIANEIETLKLNQPKE